MHWQIQGGAAGMCPPTGSISFVFAYVFTKKCMRRRSAPPNGLAPPPMGNPGSATEMHKFYTENDTANASDKCYKGICNKK